MPGGDRSIMKVVHLNEYLTPKGGVEAYLLELLPRLRGEGVASHLIYGHGEARNWPESTVLPEIGEIGFSGERALRQQLSDILRREKPDLVHIHNIQSLAVLETCLDEYPTVVTNHDYRWVCPANNFFYKRTKEVCSRAGAGLGCFSTTLVKHCLTPRPNLALYLYNRSRVATRQSPRLQRIIAPSEGAKARLVGAGIEALKISVIPYFCPVPVAEAPRPIPAQPLITFIGRLANTKGHEYFIKALGLLPRHFQGMVIGSFSPPEEARLRAIAKAHCCSDRLKFFPWASRDEVVRRLDETTVFIFPSLWEETLGIVGIEALARGVPVVASDLGGVGEWLRHGQNGYLVPPKSPEAIRDAVLRLVQSPKTLLSAGWEGIATVREKFLPSQHLEKLLSLYAAVVEKATPQL
jgi:glycosyltransferase involved in cell wall biosynthesis